MIYYAHTQGNDKKDWQTLKDHLTAVAEMASAFAERFSQMCERPSRARGEEPNATDDYTRRIIMENPERYGAGELGYMAGILHDVGKYSAEFQAKLDGKKQRVDHSTAGAKEAATRYGQFAGRMLAYIIAGHHAGLSDYYKL